MQKIKQIDRPYLIFRCKNNQRKLYTCCATIKETLTNVVILQNKYKKEIIEVYKKGDKLSLDKPSDAC